MSKRSRRRAREAAQKRQKAEQRRNQKGEPETKKLTSEPWLSQRTGFRAMGVLSLVLAAFMTWQLWPSEGPVGAILWGLGFGLSVPGLQQVDSGAQKRVGETKRYTGKGLLRLRRRSRITLW